MALPTSQPVPEILRGWTVARGVPAGTVKLAFVERAGTRDRDLSSSQAAIVTASQMRKERPRSSR